MINRIIDFSVKNKPIIFMLVAVGCIWGWWSMKHVSLDAIPDLSDTQVIIFSRWDRSPDLVEAQVTYPIVTTMVGAPKVKAVRGFSDFGYSYVYVIFEDDTDIYWARSRTLEYLSAVLPRLPEGAKTEIGPDATPLGWIFQYALVDESGNNSLADLRSYQDFYLKYYLRAVPGVAEVAPVGGFGKQYQVNVDPNRLQAYSLSINRVVEAVREGNYESAGRLIEFGGTEYSVRGRGYVTGVEDIENIAVSVSDSGTPICIKDIGQVVLGPDIRRGVADLDGTGDVVSGIVIMRHGQNALDVIERVKTKLREIEPGLPPGVKVVPIYDRSDLILSAIDNLKSTVIEVVITVALVVFIFLRHIPSAVIPVITLPIVILLSFIPFRMLGVTANIMSLGGIAIAIGAMVDAAIVVVEQTHKGLEQWEQTGRREDYRSVVIRAVKQVAGPSFFALLVIAVAFLPVLTLEAQEGRLFKPLAYTKTLAMIIAALLAITLDPALRLFLTRMSHFSFRPRWLSGAANKVLVGTIHSEEKHPVSRFLIRVYDPVVTWTLRWKWVVICGALALMVITVPIYSKLGSEFMPPLDEGSILYMPTTMPGISIAEAQRVLQVTDRMIKQFPEVKYVLGKAGRAETSTDPAPLSMLETVIILKPKSEWRKKDVWYASWAPEWAKRLLRHITPDHISQQELIAQMNDAVSLPGLANSWTMPIKGRIDMLSTGLRTPVGLKVTGSDLGTIEEIGIRIESLLPSVKGTRGVFAERTASGYFIDFEWNRKELARYGLSMQAAQAVVENAIGGDNVTTTVEGQERYPVNVRYKRDFRSDLGALRRVLVPVSEGQKQIPLGHLADIRMTSGPSMIRNEDGLLSGYVYVDIADRDPNGYIEEADRLLRKEVKLPPGYAAVWSGDYQASQRVKERLTVVVPLTLFLILLLLYLNTRSMAKTFIVLLAVPFSAIGAFWFLYLLDYNLSIGVWVGLIALLGVDAETGVFMLLYLDLAYEKAKSEGRLRSLADLREAIRYGAVKRLRPKFMTVATTFLGLVPILWAVGTGSDVMKRIAAPMVGGIFTSFLLELLVYPAIYQIWKWNSELKRQLS
ncbi:MAG: efflux RND transporter permease subunit [Deltaproteobacteria bacterium]|nr:efflux RND transporter permease subunit [Deltaproteobacteria bacterium]